MQANALWQDYLELCKPRVVALMLLTAVVGMYLAGYDGVSLKVLVFGNVGIAFLAGAAAAINHVIDRHIDTRMRRTERRPVATGRVSTMNALIFAGVLSILGLLVLYFFVNTLTALLTLATLIGYAIVYTAFLKHATPQNIVIGGLAGAAPPLLGWTAVTGSMDPHALLLVLIIFVWTPPHFWALAIHRYDDYVKADVPMLPVTHSIEFTKTCILLYTLLLLSVSVLPFVYSMSGVLYLIAALVLGGIFMYHAVLLKYTNERTRASKTFRYSIVYLMLLFIVLLVDHYLI